MMKRKFSFNLAPVVGTQFTLLMLMVVANRAAESCLQGRPAWKADARSHAHTVPSLTQETYFQGQHM